MTENRQYSESFREQALLKVYGRGRDTVKMVAEELNMSCGTLKNWMKCDKKKLQSKAGQRSKRPSDWSLAERLELLKDSHGLGEEALSALCREKGVFRHHLERWQAEFLKPGQTVDRSQLRELKETNKALTGELNRKEKALAEAAALLVLQKKFRGLWEEGDG